jgi:dipeptidase D
VDISLQRANAYKLMFLFLKKAVAEFEARWRGSGMWHLRNAIPREGFCSHYCSSDGVDELMNW